jgi:hypothetical protein
VKQSEIEQKARRLGARRKRHSDEGDEIQKAIKSLAKESEGVVTRERLCDLLGMHRSSLYELYIGGSSDGDDREEASGGAREGEQRSHAA